ncbi:MAG: sulfotransferase [bacterium]|nr:sulfotransferase [bacterium]
MTPLRIGIGAVRTLIMAALGPLEKWQLNHRADDPAPVCFVLGPPRSGTTLLYELLISRYRFAYLSNLAHRFYLTPVAATRLGRSGIQQWQGGFESSYGNIEGWAAPSEGGWIWNRWFPEESYLDEGRGSVLPVETIRRTVHALSGVLGAPFLNKNVMHSVHMRLLDHLFPGCLFVHLQRDPAENIRSILRAREHEGGPELKEDWWSVKPRQWQRYRGASRAVQAAAQVLHIHRDVSLDAEYLGPGRCIVVDYADVCSDPNATVDRIGVFLAAGGVELHDHATLPREFRKSSAGAADSALEAEISAALKQVEADFEGSAEICQ